MANSYDFHQAASILNFLTADAQGKTANIATTPRNTSEFVTMGTTALAMGTDPIMHSINQLINRTITSWRPYTRKFSLLDVSDVEFGNAVRKLTPIFTQQAENQPMYNDIPADGQSVDDWTIKRPKTVQMNFIGAEQWEVQAPTVFIDQLKSAFRSPDDLMMFMTAQAGEVQNEIEQQHEVLARGTVANMIGATNVNNAASVVHLVTEYNAATGLNLTATSVMQPANFAAFIEWAFARIQNISDQLEERSTKWHVNLYDASIVRHTPKPEQRLLMYSPALNQVQNIVRTGLYNNNLLTLAPHEGVTFWQNLNQPDQINVTPKYMDVDGTVKTGAAQAIDGIFGVLYDRNAMGVNIISDGVDTTRVNAKARYYNTFHHFVRRFYADQTENFVVFLLD